MVLGRYCEAAAPLRCIGLVRERGIIVKDLTPNGEYTVPPEGEDVVTRRFRWWPAIRCDLKKGLESHFSFMFY